MHPYTEESGYRSWYLNVVLREGLLRYGRDFYSRKCYLFSSRDFLPDDPYNDLSYKKIRKMFIDQYGALSIESQDINTMIKLHKRRRAATLTLYEERHLKELRLKYGAAARAIMDSFARGE